MSNLIKEIAKIVRAKFEGEGSGHDWLHIQRVRKIAMALGKKEGANLEVVELGALLHDIADHKFHAGDEHIGWQTGQRLLLEHKAEQSMIDRVVEIIKEISFKGANVATPMSSIEGRVVQDADRLDAIGAMGIARCFAYGGHAGQPIYDPAIKIVLHDSFDAYKNAEGTSINHFYEKLLLLKDRMNTEHGKIMAQNRHDFMLNFLKQFDAETQL